MTGTLPVTAMVLTRNSAATLDACLDSLGDVAEIIVNDGRSTDATTAIAARHGARVLSQADEFIDADGRLRDYAGARHQVVEAASQPWILHLDADEIATVALIDDLRRTTADSAALPAYLLPARHVVDGIAIRSAANYPMSYLRFFRRDAVTGYAGPINERPELATTAEVGQLEGEFMIPLPPFRDVLRKWGRYQRIVFHDARTSPRPAEVVDAGERLRVIRWLVWRTWRSRRSEPGPHMPLRVEIGRVAFHIAALLSAAAGAALGRASR